MATVWLIVGYCGSGKSHRASQMLETQRVQRKFDEGFLDSVVQHSELIQALRDDLDCVVVEINYCLEAQRRSITEELEREVPGVRIEWEYFEANLETANQNCRIRKNKPEDPRGYKHIYINGIIGSNYRIPHGVTPLPIHPHPQC
jgi:hypothetical protein